MWSKGQQLKPIHGGPWPWTYATTMSDKHTCASPNAKVTLLESVNPDTKNLCLAKYGDKIVRIHAYEWTKRESFFARFILFLKDELGY